MKSLIDVELVRAAAISKIWYVRYMLPIKNNAKIKLAKSKYDLPIITRYFDRYYRTSMPEEKSEIFQAAYHYFPKRIPFLVGLLRQLNIKIGSSIDD